jgi:ubiquinone biosynthesis protein
VNPSSNPDPLSAGIADIAGRIAAVAGASFELAAHVVERVERLVVGVVLDSREVAEQSEVLVRIAAEQASALGGVLRATPRFARVTGEVLRIVALYRVQQTRDALLSPERAAREREALHRHAAERLYELCVELRGGVLKVGQFVSTRMDLLPLPYVEALSRLQDRVPAVPYEEVAARLTEELGAPPDEVFATFERAPIAAASLAQVHGATLADGTRVAVKIQVPGIEDVIDADLLALSVLSSMLRDLLPQLDVPTIADELARAVREELDYQREAANAAAVAASFADDPRVVVPRVHAAFSTRRVLVMDRVDGVPLLAFLDDCERRGADGAQARDHVLATLIDTTCAQVLRDGLFQGDPHPGNFLVADVAKLALLDFGAVQKLTHEQREAYAQLAGAVLLGNAPRAAELLDALGFRTASGDPEPLVEVANVVLAFFRDRAGSSLADADPERTAAEFLAAIEANPVVRIPGHFVLLGRVFASLGGLLLRYRPQIDLYGVILPHLFGGCGAPAASGA